MRYKIIFMDKDKVDEKVLRKVQSKHSEDVEGINDLYEQLILHGTCDSTEVSRIYYVAYTLSLEKIEMIIARMN